MKVSTSCGALALAAAVTASVLAQDDSRGPTPLATAVAPTVATSAPAAAWNTNLAAATSVVDRDAGGPSPLGYLAIGGGAALVGCVWLSRRYRVDG